MIFLKNNRTTSKKSIKTPTHRVEDRVVPGLEIYQGSGKGCREYINEVYKGGGCRTLHVVPIR
jgi:hypothetical protein